MNGYSKRPHYPTPVKHKEIYRTYLSLRKEKLEADPIAASFLSVSYYAEVISRNPLVGLCPSSIQRIINAFDKGLRKLDDEER